MTSEKSLKAAEVELAEAERELQKAEEDVEKAEHDVENALEQEKQLHEFKIGIIYNGVEKPFEVHRDELVQRLLDQAKQAFGPINNNAHLLSLFNKEGLELKDEQTLEQAGVKPHDVLLMRPSQVRGG